MNLSDAVCGCPSSAPALQGTSLWPGQQLGEGGTVWPGQPTQPQPCWPGQPNMSCWPGTQPAPAPAPAPVPSPVQVPAPTPDQPCQPCWPGSLPPQPYQPQPYQPQPAQAYQPQPAQAYQPQPAQAYQPQPALPQPPQQYLPQPPQAYQPPPSQPQPIQPQSPAPSTAPGQSTRWPVIPGQPSWPFNPGQSGWPGQHPNAVPSQWPNPPAAVEVTVPYNLNLARGIYDKMMMTIRGHVKPNAKMFTINFLRGNDIAFHLNPRFNDGGKQVIVRNHRQGETWGKEERDLKGPFPFTPGNPFEIKILCTYNEFKVAVNIVPSFEFKHRIRELNQIDRINILHDVVLTYVKVDTLP